MKRLLVLSIWFPITLITLVISLFAFQQISETKKLKTLVKNELRTLAENPYRMYYALPKSIGRITSAIKTGDARPEILRQYLERYHSPIAPYSDLLFEAGEKYGLDYRLMTAIAQCESNLCKKIPPGSFNCWGFENGATKFLSWEHAFERVAKTLKERYIDEGLVTPEQIMPKYAPPSIAKGGPWAKCVNQFFGELEYCTLN